LKDSTGSALDPRRFRRFAKPNRKEALFGKLCPVGYLDSGRVVMLSTAERDQLILRDRAIRREAIRASRMYGTKGRLLLLDVPVMCQ
jgi:hypothetical protein